MVAFLKRLRGKEGGPFPQPAAPVKIELTDVARQVLTSLEGVLTKAANGAARTAIRLGNVARRHEGIEASAQEVEAVTGQLRASIDNAARAASQTAEASRRVADISREGQGVSRQSMESMRALVEHSERTDDRLRSLLVKIREVAGVSRVIDDIATRTRLLALNASIEATRAGAAGRAFGVVAGEVRDLAKTTTEKTQKIEELMRGILADLEPARAALEQSRALAAQTAERVDVVGEKLSVVYELAALTSGHVEEIAAALHEESQGMATLGAATQNVASSIKDLRAEVAHLAAEAFAVGVVTEDGHRHLALVELDTMFHRGLACCRELAERCGQHFARAIEQGRVHLDRVLALEYREIRGAEIQSLARLFDVRRVPPSGFTPPKYHTGYDAALDDVLQPLCDEILKREARMTFALPIDLNSYGPTHNRRYTQDCTGDPAKDLAGNRTKRFFTDNHVLVRGARVGLGARAEALPDRATRADFARAGVGLAASPAQREAFMVQTYARDTGALITVVTVPIFVRDQRWGAALVGWTEDGADQKR